MHSHNRISHSINDMDNIDMAINDNPKPDSKNINHGAKPPSSDLKAGANLQLLPILLVEDYEPILVVASILFDFLGYPYVVARNGQEAVDKFTSAKYSIVLMDVEMPILNGYEATIKIREYEASHKLLPIAIVAMTSHADVNIKEKCLAAGMDDYIAKPYTPQLLEAVLEKYMQKANGTAASS